MRISALLAAFLIGALAAPLPASAWGSDGHRFINGDAIRALLPGTVPPFVRTVDAIAEITALGPEADRDRGAGKPRDADWDEAHFLDMDDDGTIGGTLQLAQLPETREAYDTALRTGATPFTEYSRGFLPYEIIEGYQLLVRDFAFWRVDSYFESVAAGKDRAFYTNDRKLRETLILRDIGFWGHFVADGSQPLHVTVHFNGWGQYPNPNNYTQSTKIHSKFETAFVNAHTSAEAMMSHIAPYVPSDAPIFGRVETYLAATNSHVAQVYELEGAGAFDAATPAAVDFTLARLADGAKMMRDLIADAYAASLDAKLLFPAKSVRDILNGAVKPTHGIANG